MSTAAKPMNLLENTTITCPFCWEKIELEIDLSVDEQDYIEDCQVCCQPVRVHYHSHNGEITNIETERANG